MHIAFDITETCSRQPTGCGRYTQFTIQGLIDEGMHQGGTDQYELFYRRSHRKRADFGFCPKGYTLKPLPRGGFSLKHRPDIIHGFATHAPSLGKARRVVTLMDVFSALDESAQWQSAHSRKRKLRQYEKLAKNCDLIITISETTKVDFLNHFDYPKAQIHAVHGGVDAIFTPSAKDQLDHVRNRYGIPESYLLYVGAPVARKNVPRLIDAYVNSSVHQECALVVAGTINNEAQQMMLDLKQTNPLKQVYFIGYVPESDLPALYAGAKAMLFPTFYEGFGMPVLEAMACGVPVLIGNRGAAPEIAAGYATEVDPYEIESIRDGIDHVIHTSQDQRAEAIRHARRFTWEKTASKVHDLYKNLIN